MTAKTRNAAECSQVCSDRNKKFAAAPDANRTAMAEDDAGAFTAIENSSAHSTQKTAAAPNSLTHDLLSHFATLASLMLGRHHELTVGSRHRQRLCPTEDDHRNCSHASGMSTCKLFCLYCSLMPSLVMQCPGAWLSHGAGWRAGVP